MSTKKCDKCGDEFENPEYPKTEWCDKCLDTLFINNTNSEVKNGEN